MSNPINGSTYSSGYEGIREENGLQFIGSFGDQDLSQIIADHTKVSSDYATDTRSDTSTTSASVSASAQTPEEIIAGVKSGEIQLLPNKPDARTGYNISSWTPGEIYEHSKVVSHGNVTGGGSYTYDKNGKMVDLTEEQAKQLKEAAAQRPQPASVFPETNTNGPNHGVASHIFDYLDSDDLLTQKKNNPLTLEEGKTYSLKDFENYINMYSTTPKDLFINMESDGRIHVRKRTEDDPKPEDIPDIRIPSDQILGGTHVGSSYQSFAAYLNTWGGFSQNQRCVFLSNDLMEIGYTPASGRTINMVPDPFTDKAVPV